MVTDVSKRARSILRRAEAVQALILECFTLKKQALRFFEVSTTVNQSAQHNINNT
jgi:hypothetical protein